MLLKYFYDRALAQASYMVGDQAAGEALIIDPMRDVTPYLDAARAEALTITQVAETHIHADFVSGSRELAARSGARLYLSGSGGADWAYQFGGDNRVLLHDGDQWRLGSVRIDVLHTPGHTPEHLIFQITDTRQTDQPLGLFTGDCLFVGDVGRPDLLETAVGIAGSSEPGARQQFRNVERLKTLPDYLQVLPGHGAGSACGKTLGSLPSSTLGYEKRVNPAFQFSDEAAFAAWLLDGQPETPTYFRQMKRVNQAGAALLDTLAAPLPMEGVFLSEILRNGALVIDCRADGTNAHVPGALHIAPDDQFSTYAGWFVDYDAPTYLIAAPEQVAGLVRDLRAIGVDDLPGYFPPGEVEYLSVDLPKIGVAEAAKRIEAGALLLDVRSASEYAEKHIDGAQQSFYGRLPQQLDDLPRDRSIVIQCASGTRSQIAASLLMRHGFTQFTQLEGGIEAWERAGYPLIGDMGR